MSIVIAFALIVAQSASPADPMPPAKPVCQKVAGSQPVVATSPAFARVHPLNQEPPAKQVLTVVRTFGGCSKPVVVRENIGAPKR